MVENRVQLISLFVVPLPCIAPIEEIDHVLPDHAARRRRPHHQARGQGKAGRDPRDRPLPEPRAVIEAVVR